MSLLSQFYNCGGDTFNSDYGLGGAAAWFALESAQGGVVYRNIAGLTFLSVGTFGNYSAVSTKRIFGQNWTMSGDSSTTFQNTIQSISGGSLNSTGAAQPFAFQAGSVLTEYIGGLNIEAANFDFTQCTLLTKVRLNYGFLKNGGTANFNGCSLTQASVDSILAAFAYSPAYFGSGAGSLTGTIDLGGAGNAAPSAAGVTARTQLLAYGYTVTTN